LDGWPRPEDADLRGGKCGHLHRSIRAPDRLVIQARLEGAKARTVLERTGAALAGQRRGSRGIDRSGSIEPDHAEVPNRMMMLPPLSMSSRSWADGLSPRKPEFTENVYIDYNAVDAYIPEGMKLSAKTIFVSGIGRLRAGAFRALGGEITPHPLKNYAFLPLRLRGADPLVETIIRSEFSQESEIRRRYSRKEVTVHTVESMAKNPP
jgi:hypothetical protein